MAFSGGGAALGLFSFGTALCSPPFAQDIGAIVINMGAHTVRAGDAGDDTPKLVFSSHVGVLDAQYVTPQALAAKPQDPEVDAMDISEAPAALEQPGAPSTAYFFDTGISLYRDHQTVQTPFDDSGLVRDWDLASRLWEQTFLRLGIDNEDGIDRPLLFSEPTFTTKQHREKMTEVVFEKFKPTGFFLAKESTLSSFASGRSTSVVLDIGDLSSTVSILHDGYVLQKSIIRSSLGGKKLSEITADVVRGKVGHDIRPRYLFEKKKAKSGKMDVKPLNRAHVTPSYHAFEYRSIFDDVKLNCKISPKPFGDWVELTKFSYEFPDGAHVDLEKELFQVPELLFKPSAHSATARSEDGSERPGVVEMLNKILTEAEPDLRKDLYQNVIVTGGSTLFSGFTERLQNDLAVLTPSMYKLKIVAPSASVERRFSSWIGGSILASLGSLSDMWVSKQQYDEVGSAIVHKRFP